MRFLVALMIAQNMQKFRFKLALYQPLNVVVKDIVVGTGGSPPLQRCFSFSEFEIVSQRHKDGLRHSLHASA